MVVDKVFPFLDNEVTQTQEDTHTSPETNTNYYAI